MTRFALLLAASGAVRILSGQAMVEYSLGVSGAAGAGASMSATGKAIGNALGKATGALNQAAQSSANQTANSSTVIVLPAQPALESAPKKFIAPDPAQVKQGMKREELVAKFGEPAMKIQGVENSETWWYGTDPETVTVKLDGGKVVSVTPPPCAAPAAEKPCKPLTAKADAPAPVATPDTGIKIIR